MGVMELSKISAEETQRRKMKREEIRERYRKATEERLRKKAEQPLPKPIYDDVFFEGMAWLDSLAKT
jgi:hypothetical protein